MADEWRPTSDVQGTSCDEVQDSLELLALDALDPSERELVVAHVEGCARCRAELAAVEETIGSVLRLAPPAEVPPGFADRVVAAARVRAPEPAAAPRGGAEVGTDRRSRRRRGLALAAAAVVVALVLTGLGVALGTVFAADDRVASPPVGTAPVSTAPTARAAALLAADGTVAGSVTVDAAGTTLGMTVDSARAGVPYDCVVRDPSGALVTVGSWTPPTSGPATWEVALDPSLSATDEVLLVGPGGRTLATARLA